MGAEPHWSGAAHETGSMRGKGCYPVEMGQVPSNYMKRQMQMGGDSATSLTLALHRAEELLSIPSSVSRCHKCNGGRFGMFCSREVGWSNMG